MMQKGLVSGTRMTIAALCATLVYAGDPECSMTKCTWSPEQNLFGDARYINSEDGRQLRVGKPYSYLQKSLCSPANWRSYAQCQERCPLAIVITEPANITMRACMTPSSFNPYADGQHINIAHPLNNQVLELVGMSKPGSKAREACEIPPDANTTDYRNKIVVTKRGGCYFADKGATVSQLGGKFALVVDYTSSRQHAFFPFTMGGSSEGFENTPSAMMTPQFGDIILNALDKGQVVKGHVSLDCSVMDLPAPPPSDVPENCPSTSLFEMCDDMETESDQLCARCGVQAAFVDSKGENHTSCLYNHQLIPAESKNSLVTIGGPDKTVSVHLADFIPEFLPDPTCKDLNATMPDGSIDQTKIEPYTAVSCQEIADLIDSRQMTSCAYLLQEGFPDVSTPWFLENCHVTCPRSVGGVGCKGGTGDGCDSFDFVNAAGMVVAIKKPSTCTPFQMVRYASQAGAAGIIMLADECEECTTSFPNPVFVDGLAKYIDLPVHALDFHGSRALEEAIKAANAANPLATSVDIVITQNEPVPPPQHTPAPTLPADSLAGLEGSSEFQWTDSVIISVVFGFLLFFLNIGIFVNQRINSIELPRQSKKKSGLKIPLSAASMGLSLSLLMTIAVVGFFLAYSAGKDTTDSALDDGWSAVEKTHQNAVTTVAQLKDQLLVTMVDRVSQGIVAGLDAGALAAQQASKIFLTSDGSWEDFDSRIWMLTEFSSGFGTSSNWNLAVRTTRGFFASPLLKTDDRPNASRDDGSIAIKNAENEVGHLDGQPHVSVTQDGTRYGFNFQSYREGGNVNREFMTRGMFDPSLSLGRSWATPGAKELMAGSKVGRGQVFCYTPEQTIPVQNYLSHQYGSRPLSCLTQIHNKEDEFLGTIQSYIGLEWFGRLLGNTAASKFTQNMTIIVFNEHSQFVTSSKGRTSRIVDNYGEAISQFLVSALSYGPFGTFTDLVTEPIALEYHPEPFLNAAANYMKGPMKLGGIGNATFDFKELRKGTAAGSGEFDQREWYGKGQRMTRYVVNSFSFDQQSTQDTSGQGWVATLQGSGNTWVPGARGTSSALKLDGRGYMELSMYMSPNEPRVLAGDNPSYNDRTVVNNHGVDETVVAFNAFDYWHGDGVFPLLKEPIITSTFSLSMWMNPSVAVDDGLIQSATSPTLFSDTRISFQWSLKVFANGRMFLTEYESVGAYGCATKPIPGGPSVGRWTHLTVVVDRNYRGVDAEQEQKTAKGAQMCRVYVNGVLHDEQPMGAGLVYYDTMIPNSEPYYIGQNFNGALDEITFFNSTLSSVEIKSIMQVGPLAYSKDVPSKNWYLQVKEENNYNMTWGVATLIPRDDIMRTVDMLNELQQQNQTILRQNTENKLDQNLAEVMLIIVAIALASIAIFLIFNEILTRPFALFARQMTDVACMKVEDVEMDTASSLREIDSMHNAMTLMVKNLKEYKSYMPQTMLMMNEEEEDDPSETCTSKDASSKGISRKDSAMVDRGSTRSSITNRSSMQQSVVSTNLAKARKQEAAVKVGALQGKRCSFLSVNVQGFLSKGLDRSKIVPTHTQILDILLQSCSVAKGVPDTFCGDRIFCSFNAVRQVSGFRSSAVTAAHMSRCKVDQAESLSDFPLSFAVVTGECQVGNMGTAMMRRFSFHSSVVPWAVALERHQRDLGCRGVVDAVTKEEASSKFTLRLIDAPIFAKRKAEAQRVYEVVEARESAEEEEWMYQLEKQKANDPNAVWNDLVDKVIKNEMDGAKAKFDDAVKTFQAAGGSAIVVKKIQSALEQGVHTPTEIKWH